MKGGLLVKAEDFLARVQQCMPTRDALEAAGLDDEEIVDIQSAFRHQPRGEVHLLSNEIERMIEENDCFRIEVLGVRFLSHARAHPMGTAVAEWEADPIVVSSSGEVAAFDHVVPTFRLEVCAATPSGFLAALVHLLEARTSGVKYSESEAASLATHCAALAQHPGTFRFYRALFGMVENL